MNKVKVAQELVKVARDLESARDPWTEKDVSDYLKRMSKDFLGLAKDVQRGKDVTTIMGNFAKGMGQVSRWHKDYLSGKTAAQNYGSWEKEAIKLMKKEYGLDKNDWYDRSDFKDAFEEGVSPGDLVEEHAEKYDLTEI